MRRRHASIPQRRRIFLGCEGESEQGYGKLLSELAEASHLHLAFQLELLRPGGGDPLGLITLALERSRHAEQKRGSFSCKAVLLDRDKLSQARERDSQMYKLAETNKLHLIWQDPCHEALLLRHLPDCQTIRPATTSLALQVLKRHWPEYTKAMSAMRLGTRIGLDDVRRACKVEASLANFLARCGFET